MTSIPKKAATIILLRDKNAEEFEVFLLKRHEQSSFMGGNYVFPGGRVDLEDGSLETCALCKGVTLEEGHRMFGCLLSPQESLGHWIAGIRELFEEGGILLAYDHFGNLLQFKNKGDGGRFIDYRDQLQKRKTTICQVAKEVNISLALDQLHYYAHWITPEARSERFDTRFFLARHPEGQEASFDQMETTAEVWLTPQEAFEENIKGKMALSPPALKIMEDLSRYNTIEEVFDSLKKKDIQPILPILAMISNEPTILLPWDPEYEVFKRGDIPSPINHGKPSQHGDNTTRLILKQGIWYPYCRVK
jgi:8-oxo-dGTP pyrophosphatase MutT (NUDIX family)